MTAAVERMKAEAAALTAEERVALAEHLLEPSADAAWVEELNRRAAELRDDPASGRPVEEFLAELRGLYP